MALSRQDQTELMSCQICYETFKIPKILPCLHTFCEQCIHEFIISTGRKKEPHSRKEFSCPTCKTLVKPTDAKSDIDKWAANLPHNVSIQEMLDMSNGENKKCSACKRHDEISEAKFWCEICEEAFCEKCNDMHSRMKLSASHNVIPVEEVASFSYGMVVNAISEHCSVHPSNLVDVFCCDHKIICCGSCVSTKHRRCKRVMTIASLMTSGKYMSLPLKITEIKQAIESLIKEKDQEKADIKLATEDTEEEAKEFLEQLKCKLDNLFDTFAKQLHMFRDEKYTSFNVRMRLLEQFVKNLDHWIRSIEVVEKFGTKTQLFILVENIKHHIASNVSEISRVNQSDTLVDLSFQKKGIFSQLETCETMVEIGTFKTFESPIFGQMIGIYKCCAGLGLNCYPKFKNAYVTFVKSICITGSKFSCGVCIDEKYMVVGDARPQKKLYIIEKHSGYIVSTTDIHGDVKRLCYDKKSKQLFISCYSEELYKADVKAEEIIKVTKMPFNEDHVGALFSSNNDVYVVVNRAIKKFSINADSDDMTTCFYTNTECGLNGMNVIGKYIVFTTADNEIKCSTLQGKRKFCYKNDELESPKCIAVLSSGLTLVVDRANSGSLHLLSEDGLKHRRLLEKFDNVNNPADIWLDGNEELVYVAGGKYIDTYRIVADQQNDSTVA
ncbi:uncharacterized protein LOC143045463 [Mytilus galloprovincialis]|uniref:uncharacterized protein LOC143045463 n=1 Tax=Mytilus galloprovincialis TaxID=29158 RepID=UPI003F7BB39A